MATNGTRARATVRHDVRVIYLMYFRDIITRGHGSCAHRRPASTGARVDRQVLNTFLLQLAQGIQRRFSFEIPLPQLVRQRAWTVLSFMVSESAVAGVAENVTWLHACPLIMLRHLVPLHAAIKGVVEGASPTPKSTRSLEAGQQSLLFCTLSDQGNCRIVKLLDKTAVALSAERATKFRTSPQQHKIL